MKHSCFSICCVACLSALSLLSCGGGGGKNENPLDQPSTFLPENATEVRISIQGGGDDVPKRITLKKKGETSSSWSAGVEDSAEFKLHSEEGLTTKAITCKLTGNVNVEKLDGNAGFRLAWDGDDPSSDKAVWEGTMGILFYALDDKNGCRYASVVTDDLKIHYQYNGVQEKGCSIRGCTMILRFAPSGTSDEKSEETASTRP